MGNGHPTCYSLSNRNDEDEGVSEEENLADIDDDLNDDMKGKTDVDDKMGDEMGGDNMNVDEGWAKTLTRPYP